MVGVNGGVVGVPPEEGLGQDAGGDALQAHLAHSARGVWKTENLFLFVPWLQTLLDLVCEKTTIRPRSLSTHVAWKEERRLFRAA